MIATPVLIGGLPSPIQSVTISWNVACAQTISTYATDHAFQDTTHMFLTPSPIQMALSTAGEQVSYPPSLTYPCAFLESTELKWSSSLGIIATTALYGELGHGNVSKVYQSPAAIPCTPPSHSLFRLGLALTHTMNQLWCLKAHIFFQGSVAASHSSNALCSLLVVPSPSPSPSAVPIPQAPFMKPIFNNVIPQVKLLPIGPLLFALCHCFLCCFWSLG